MSDPQPCGSAQDIPVELWDDEPARETLWNSLRENLDEYAAGGGYVIDEATVKRHDPIWLRISGDADEPMQTDREHAHFARIKLEAVAVPQ